MSFSDLDDGCHYEAFCDMRDALDNARAGARALAMIGHAVLCGKLLVRMNYHTYWSEDGADRATDGALMRAALDPVRR